MPTITTSPLLEGCFHVSAAKKCIKEKIEQYSKTSINNSSRENYKKTVEYNKMKDEYTITAPAISK
jgi:hypothetical protein